MNVGLRPQAFPSNVMCQFLSDCLGSFASCENGIVLSREALSRFASYKQSITMINEVIMTLDMPLRCRCSRRNQSPPKVVGSVAEEGASKQSEFFVTKWVPSFSVCQGDVVKCSKLVENFLTNFLGNFLTL